MKHTKTELSGAQNDLARADRRRFCAGLVVIGASACTAPSNQIAVGSLDSGFVGGPDDLARAEGTDLAGRSDDLATSGGTQDMAKSAGEDLATSTSTCAAGTSAGAASAIVEGTPKYLSSIAVYVCRDADGLYAMSSKCTHQSCKLTPGTTQFYCNCHGATFDLNGQNPTSPAHSALAHYALCVDSSGDVQVDHSQTVASSTRA